MKYHLYDEQERHQGKFDSVYEEFNRSQDNDGRLVWYTIMKNLFKKHSYGTQTTIGTSEHLKNPSMEKIHEYFDERYVPNNMAIILAGDIDPDQTVDLIKKYFGVIILFFIKICLEKYLFIAIIEDKTPEWV